MKPPFTNEAKSRPATADLSEADYHRLMTAERRRVALDLLADEATPVELTELAEQVAEAETDGVETGAEAVDRVALTLHHLHLPKMSEVGVVDYDPEANQVTSHHGSS